MEEEKSNRDFQKYAEDIATIKSMLMAADEKFFYDPWVFYIWGAVMIIATAAQYILNVIYSVSLLSIFFKLWIPVMIVGMVTEFIALISKISKEGVPFFARYILKLWVGAMGSMGGLAIMIIILHELDGAHYMPVVIPIVFAVYMFHVAQISYPFLFIYGYLFLACALMLFIAGMPLEVQFLISEGFTGLIMFAIGISTYLKERKHEK